MVISLVKSPPTLLPNPLRAAYIPSFTHYSVVVRLPEIAQRVVADNQFPPKIIEKIETLIAEIHSGLIRPVIGIPEKYGWDQYVVPYQGMDWLEIPWFFAEEYFYLRILEACEYFSPGERYLLDPYKHQKQLGLESTREGIHQLANQVGRALSSAKATWKDTLPRLLLADLWGNQNDLSMWPVEQNEDGKVFFGGTANPRETSRGANYEMDVTHTHVLADDTGLLLDALGESKAEKTRIDIILDNAGYELVADLALADFFLSSGLASELVLHAKCYPVFVSDSLEHDIIQTLNWMCFLRGKSEREMAIRLRLHLIRGALRLESHPFWTSPLPAWEMPEDLACSMSQSTLMIWKGDANYRRLLGDKHWDLTTPFASVVNYFRTSVLALRTCKSEIAVGISPNLIPLNDETWLFNGQWGLIQFSPGMSD